jgi:hypothetical protein
MLASTRTPLGSFPGPQLRLAPSVLQPVDSTAAKDSSGYEIDCFPSTDLTASVQAHGRGRHPQLILEPDTGHVQRTSLSLVSSRTRRKHFRKHGPVGKDFVPRADERSRRFQAIQRLLSSTGVRRYLSPAMHTHALQHEQHTCVRSFAGHVGPGEKGHTFGSFIRRRPDRRCLASRSRRVAWQIPGRLQRSCCRACRARATRTAASSHRNNSRQSNSTHQPSNHTAPLS